MTETEYYHRLQNKLALLDKIAVNTGIQFKFVLRLEIRGLQRLLRERTKLLHALTMLNESIRENKADSIRCRLLQKQIKARQQEITVLNEQAIQAAMLERDKLATALRSSRRQRQVTAQYQQSWRAGRCYNRKG